MTRIIVLIFWIIYIHTKRLPFSYKQSIWVLNRKQGDFFSYKNNYSNARVLLKNVQDNNLIYEEMCNLSMNSRDRVIGRDIDKFELLSKISIVYHNIFAFIFTLKGNFRRVYQKT